MVCDGRAPEDYFRRPTLSGALATAGTGGKLVEETNIT
jgi:hypothetical protein